MSEAVTFWMENKNCVGKMAASIDDQALVIYRDRYHLLQNGVALTKGGRPLRYSLSSLPPLWKRALKGEVPPGATPTGFDLGSAPIPQKLERKKAEKPAMIEQMEESTVLKTAEAPGVTIKSPKKRESKTETQPPVVANCPYCNAHHELQVEKGKNGKPFFITCVKCTKDFAVRLVPVTMYQAQVAGFR